MNKQQIRKIRQVYRTIVQLEQCFEKNFGLNLNEGVALCYLSDSAGMTSGEMAETLELTTSNCSKVMCSLEKMGYVTRTIDKDDRRSMHFTLTVAGNELITRMHCCDIAVPEQLKPLVDES